MGQRDGLGLHVGFLGGEGGQDVVGGGSLVLVFLFHKLCDCCYL